MGCGRGAAKGELVRLAVCDDVVVVDSAQRLPGRGAYVCSDACLARARRRGALARAFRRPVSFVAQTVESEA